MEPPDVPRPPPHDGFGVEALRLERVLQHRIRELAREVVEDRDHQVIAIADVPTDQREVNVGCGGDLAERHGVDAVPSEEHRGGIEDGAADVSVLSSTHRTKDDDREMV